MAKRIETLLREKYGRPNLVLADHFHYLGGTSTGAIIATFLSAGHAGRQVIRLYRENSRVMFTKAGWGAIFKNRFAGKPISDFLRSFFVEADGKPATLGTAKLGTLLLVVTRNASTGSPWPMSNNPRAMFNDRSKPGCNLDLPLWQIVRASTAAPTFFPGGDRDRRPAGWGIRKQVFAFEDGGVTPFNNPAYLLYTMATLPSTSLAWPDGKERMSLVSVGTGRVKTGRGSAWWRTCSVKPSLPSALIGSAQWMQDLICRQQGECRYGDAWTARSVTWSRENPRGSFLYARYDRAIGEAEIEAALAVNSAASPWITSS